MKEKQIIKFENNVDSVSLDNNSCLFVRVKDSINSKDAILEVPYTHCAYVIKGGGEKRFYESGSYKILETKEEVKNWKQGLSVDVIYIPKETNVTILWGTPSRMSYRDDASGRIVTVGARGNFRIEILNTEQFMRKVVGTALRFNTDKFQDEFRSDVVSEFRDVFLDVIKDNSLSYDMIDKNLKLIGDAVGEVLTEKFKKTWGIGLEHFTIEAAAVDSEQMDEVDEASMQKAKTNKLKSYLDDIAALGNNKKERSLYLAKLELEDKDTYYQILKVLDKMEMSCESDECFCPKCGAKIPQGAQFCSNCGAKLNVKRVCPKCNFINTSDARFCANCGAKLEED